MSTKHKHRDVVLLIGSTGSLGGDIFRVLEERNVPLRLLGRSWESFQRAGFSKEDLDLVVCSDVNDPAAYDASWFEDVSLVVCVARPRYPSTKAERTAYVGLVTNLSDMVCRFHVPNMLLLGAPYFDKYLLGVTPSAGLGAAQQAEECAKERFSRQEVSHLTVARISEMSEAGLLLQMAQKFGVWLCIYGYNPRMGFISSHDFALAVAQFADQKNHEHQHDLLVAGPMVVTWRELGHLVSDALGRPPYFLELPFWVTAIRILVPLLRLFGKVVPVLGKIANVLVIGSIPMTTDTISDDHVYIGSDRVEDYLREYVRRQQEADIEQPTDTRDEKSAPFTTAEKIKITARVCLAPWFIHLPLLYCGAFLRTFPHYPPVFSGLWWTPLTMSVAEISRWIRMIHFPCIIRERIHTTQYSSEKPQEPVKERIAQHLNTIFAVSSLVIAGYQNVALPEKSRQNITYLHWIGSCLVMASVQLNVWVMQTNKFAEGIVYKQEGQKLATTGPYAYVRHPYYSFLVPFGVGLPWVLTGSCSLQVFIPSLLIIATQMWRTYHEEDFLMEEFGDSYKRYRQDVRYRMFPGVF